MSVPEDALRSLPVPISGTHATGEASAAARQDAARVLYFARLLANSAGVPVWQLQRPLAQGDGSVKAQVAGPLALKKVHQQAPVQSPEEKKVLPPADLVRLVWLPEGFVITPRSKSAPDGWGMPPTKNAGSSQGFGTPDGPLRQVIINRFKNNQYPDALFLQEVKKHGAGEKDIQAIEEARKKGTLRICAANLLFQDWELLDEGFGIGLHVPDPAAKNNANRPWAKKKMVWRAQFKQRFKPEFSEQETDTWFCHRPQHAFESGLQQYLRAQTNIVRAEVDMPPLHPPVRGSEGQLSESPIYMMRYSGVIGHDSYEFRDGYIDFVMRKHQAAEKKDIAENIYVERGNIIDVAVMNAALEFWKNSPDDYHNITKDWELKNWASKNRTNVYPSFDSAARYFENNKGIHLRQMPPYSLDSIYQDVVPKIKQAVGACQIFSGQKEWVATQDPTQHIFLETDVSGRKDHRTFLSDEVYFPWRGRFLQIGTEERKASEFHVLSGCEVKISGKIKKLRVACKEKNKTTMQAHVVLYEGDVDNFTETCKEIARQDIGGKMSHGVSIPVFSESGEKMAFMYATVIGLNNDNEFDNSAGQKLHFVEFNGSFHSLGDEKVEIPAMKVTGNKQTATYSNNIDVTWRFLPVYQGEVINFIHCRVVSEIKHKIIPFHQSFHIDLTCEIIWPNGEVFKCYHVYSENNGDYYYMKGFLRWILIFDVKTPRKVLYLELEKNDSLVNEGLDVIQGGEVRLMLDKQIIKKRLIEDRTMDIDIHHTFQPMGNRINFWKISRHLNQRKHYATLVARSDFDSYAQLFEFGYQNTKGEAKGRETTYIGPPIASNGWMRAEDADDPELIETRNMFFCAEYKDEFIYAGYTSLPTLKPQGNVWERHEKYFCISTIDLENIIGDKELLNNILPIGVI